MVTSFCQTQRSPDPQGLDLILFLEPTNVAGLFRRDHHKNEGDIGGEQYAPTISD